MSNFAGVQALLKGRGIDLDHNQFLILQEIHISSFFSLFIMFVADLTYLSLRQEVESMKQMKPKGRNEHGDGLLEYLEDIIGTSSHKIEEMLAEMETLAERRGEKLNRLRIVERENNALEGQRKEALDYLRLSNDLVKAKSRLWQYYLWNCLENEIRFDMQMVSCLGFASNRHFQS